MREIYNEGRVVGLGSYELYVRQLLSTNPKTKVLTERQWLSASLSATSSMILKIPAGTQRGYHDYVLPEGSDLCGCNIIYGSVFEGEVTVDGAGVWAVRVDDYGRLIENTLSVHPVTPGTPDCVPAKADPIDLTEEYKARCRNYLKVTGALMFQPGQWNDNIYYDNLQAENGENIDTEQNEELLVPVTDMIAAKSIEPDFAELGFIRLAIAEEITEDLYILFNGFAYKTIAAGEVGFAQLYTKGVPEDGDFLGPATYPWGCKIILAMSTDVMRVAMNDMLHRN